MEYSILVAVVERVEREGESERQRFEVSSRLAGWRMAGWPLSSQSVMRPSPSDFANENKSDG